jgi:hypothetical protein
MLQALGLAVIYFHLLFENHEIIWSNGLLTESFFPGFRISTSEDRKTLTEIEMLFPELEKDGFADYVTARTALTVNEAILLAQWKVNQMRLPRHF